MKVSVIIPSLNSPSIHLTIESIKRQTIFSMVEEIIIVGLDELELIQTDEIVKFISTHIPVSAAKARNIGIMHARSEWIIFVDADCITERNWLVTLCSNNHKYQVIGGSVIIDSKNYWTLADNLSMFHSLTPERKASIRKALPTLNLLVHRNVIKTIGYFDESFTGAAGEDFDWTIRMYKSGHLLYFNPDAKVHHCPNRSTLKSLLHHSWRSGYNMSNVRLRYRDLYPSAWLFEHPTILIMLSPIISLGVSLRICLFSSIKYVKLFPAIFMSKVVWIAGSVANPYRSTLLR